MVHARDWVGTGPHRYAIRVYYEDTDAGGVVYHANYLRYFERARTEALRDAGIPHAEMTSQHGLMFMVRRINLDYLAPAVLDDSLVVTTRTTKVGFASVVLVQTVMRTADRRELVRGEVELACVKVAEPRAAGIPERWRTRLADMSLPQNGHGEDTGRA